MRNRQYRTRGRTIAACLTLACLFALVTTRAAAQSTKSCTQAAEEGQVLRKRGALSEARQRFVTCGAAACPGVVRGDCVSWLAEVDAARPTVVVGARNAGGDDATDVQLTIDGRIVAMTTDPVPLDPGEHVFRFVRGSISEERRVVLREGEIRRAIVWQLPIPSAPPRKQEPAPVSAPAPVRTSPTLVPAYVAGTTSVVLLGLSAYFGISALNERNRLEDDCAPRCSEGRIEGLRRDALLSDVFLVGGTFGAMFAVGWTLRATSLRAAATLRGVELFGRF